MLQVLRSRAKRFDPAVTELEGWRPPEDVAWIDLLAPSAEEAQAVSRALGLELPDRETMLEIETSSRLYQEDGATFMTALLLVNADSETPIVDPVSFILVGEVLVTLRHYEPRSFTNFFIQLSRQPELCSTGPKTFLGLIEAVVDRTADVLERNQATVDELSLGVFAPTPNDYSVILTRLGRMQGVNAKLRDSLVSQARLASFARLAGALEASPEHREHLATISRDVQSLLDHASYVSSNITFLLDAALGLINIQQNGILKAFSVFSIALLPPTLIGAIYGMNFDHMPELSWRFGYPMALGLMVVSAIGPLLFFKRKGWF